MRARPSTASPAVGLMLFGRLDLADEVLRIDDPMSVGYLTCGGQEQAKMERLIQDLEAKGR